VLYDKEVCAVYRAENGFVVKCASHEESKPSKKGQPTSPPEPEVYLAKSPAEVVKLVKSALAGETSEKREYDRGFEEAATSK
jgi:hypothetical protein